MNGPPSINNRPRFPEPHQEDGVASGLDVDFDNKCHEEYSQLDDIALRAVYDKARGESPPSPERQRNKIYSGVLNNSKKEKKKARRSFVIHCCIFTLFFANLLALALAGFALANTASIGTLTGSAQVAADDATVAQLRLELDELRRNLSAHNSTHNERIDDVSLQLEQLKQSCPDASTSPGVTTPLPGVTTPPDSTSVAIYENCTTTRRGLCEITRLTLLGSSPRFAECVTSKVTLEDDSEGYISDVFCSVTVEQLMPISSTLLFIDGALSCSCTALEIPHLAQLQLLPFDCEMHVTRCPALIRFPGD